jgi:hypothetical protein
MYVALDGWMDGSVGLIELSGDGDEATMYASLSGIDIDEATIYASLSMGISISLTHIPLFMYCLLHIRSDGGRGG